MGDLLVVGSCNGMISALDKKTGQVKWEYDIGKDEDQRQFHGDPLITDELVVIGTDGNMGHVYAFERSTGAVRWKYRVDERGVASDVIRLEGNVYAVTLGDELVSLDLKNGKPNWTFRGGYSGQDCLTCSSPAAAEGQVHFEGLDGFAYALNAQTGKLIWKRDLRAKVTTSAAIRGHALYLGTVKRHLYRLNIDSAEILSDFATDAAPNGRLIATDDSVFAFLGDEMFASFDLHLRKLQWSVEASKEWTSARPYLGHGIALAGNRRELILNMAVDDELITVNPARKVHPFPEAIPDVHILSFEEELNYLGLASESFKSDTIIILGQGMRPDEVFRMTYSNLDFFNRTILIVRGKPKNAKRTLSMSQEVFELLKARRQSHPDDYRVFQ